MRDHMTEADLAALRVKGDEEALDTLWIHSMALVAHIARKLEDQGRIQSAEHVDLVQEGHIAAKRAIELWEPDRGAFTTFLWPRIAGSMIRYAQTKGRTGGVAGGKATVVTASDLYSEEVLESSSFYQSMPTPEWDTVEMDGDTLMRKSSYYLTREQANVVRMKFFQGFTTKQIAEIRGTTESAVNSLIRRALETMREVLR